MSSNGRPSGSRLGAATHTIGTERTPELVGIAGCRVSHSRLPPTAWAVLLVLLLSTFDFSYFGPSWLAYLPPGLVLLVGLRACRTGRLRAYDLPILVLVIIGTVGSIYGRVDLEQTGNALAFFAPSVLAILHVWAPITIERTQQVTRLMCVIVYLGVCFAIIAYISLVANIGPFPADDYKHTRFYFLSATLVGLILLRKIIWLVGVLVLTLAEFVAYPALTSFLVAAVALAVVGVVRARGIRAVILYSAVACAAVVAVVNYSSLASLTAEYFSQVGKGDNSYARQILLRTGIEKLEASPIYGNFFTTNIAVRSHVTGPYELVPLHNDYLQFAVSGGIISAGLLVLWLVVLGLRCGIVVRRLLSVNRKEEANLITVLLVILAGFAVTAIFNPVLIDTQNAATLAAIAYLLNSLIASSNMNDQPTLAAEEGSTNANIAHP